MVMPGGYWLGDHMSDFVKQLSSYNLLNYLLTGVVFVVLAKYFTSFSLVQNDLVIGAFVYYLIGMIVSRVGSISLEPLLRRVWFKNRRFEFQFVKFAPYKDFVAASDKNPKLEILSETNNVYRSILAAVCCVLALRLVQAVETWKPYLAAGNTWLLLAGLLLLFLFSYRKQVGYIRERVESIMERNQ
jgi:hypothetical protein